MDFMGYGKGCGICGSNMGYGCCLYGDEPDYCTTCEKAIKDAREQIIYLKKYYSRNEEND